MKYSILAVLFFGLTSCSLSPSPPENPEAKAIFNTSIEDTQETNSGVITSSGLKDTENMNDRENPSKETSETGIVSSGSTDTHTGSEAKKGNIETSDITKDPEVKDITKDIDAIFSDIEKGGK